MSSKPTIVFVPGSWHGPECWDKLSTLLSAQGYKCVAVDLPSTRPDENPETATFLGDLQAARSAITAETTQGQDVVVVVHSYGGIVGCSAVRGLAVPKEPVTEPSSFGHVTGLIYLASGFMPAGLSFLGALGGSPPPQWRADTESGLAVLQVDPVEMFYHDLPRDEAELWVSRLRKQSLAALAEGGERVYPGWQDVPNWYLATLEDGGLPIEMQRMGVALAREQGATVTMREVRSSHSPMLSKPDETAAFIVDATTDFTKAKGT